MVAWQEGLSKFPVYQYVVLDELNLTKFHFPRYNHTSLTGLLQPVSILQLLEEELDTEPHFILK